MNLLIPIAAIGAAFLIMQNRRPGFTVPPAGAIPSASSDSTSSGGTSSGSTSSGGDRAVVRRLQTALNAYHFALCAPSQTNPQITIVLCRPGRALAVDGLFGPLTAESLARVYRDKQETGAPSVDAWRRLSSSQRERITGTIERAAREVAAMNYTQRREYVADVRG
jgi:hypothetical protein